MASKNPFGRPVADMALRSWDLSDPAAFPDVIPLHGYNCTVLYRKVVEEKPGDGASQDVGRCPVCKKGLSSAAGVQIHLRSCTAHLQDGDPAWESVRLYIAALKILNPTKYKNFRVRERVGMRGISMQEVEEIVRAKADVQVPPNLRTRAQKRPWADLLDDDEAEEDPEPVGSTSSNTVKRMKTSYTLEEVPGRPVKQKVERRVKQVPADNNCFYHSVNAADHPHQDPFTTPALIQSRDLRRRVVLRLSERLAEDEARRDSLVMDIRARTRDKKHLWQRYDALVNQLDKPGPALETVEEDNIRDTARQRKLKKDARARNENIQAQEEVRKKNVKNLLVQLYLSLCWAGEEWADDQAIEAAAELLNATITVYSRQTNHSARWFGTGRKHIDVWLNKALDHFDACVP